MLLVCAVPIVDLSSQYLIDDQSLSEFTFTLSLLVLQWDDGYCCLVCCLDYLLRVSWHQFIPTHLFLITQKGSLQRCFVGNGYRTSFDSVLLKYCSLEQTGFTAVTP